MAPLGVCLQVAICLTLSSLQSSSVQAKIPNNDEYGVQELIEEDFENLYGLPGIQFEHRFEVGAGKSVCLYQKLIEDAQLHVAFEVLRGADKNINLVIRMQNKGVVVEQYEWTNEGNLETVVNETDDYSFCFGNSMSRFSSKVIYFYLLSYSHQDWENYAEKVEEFEGEIQNVTQILSKVNHNAKKVLKIVSVRRGHMLNDWYTIRTNNSNVQLWSIVLCIVIVATSLFQVYFVRRLFNVHGCGVRSSSKPRA